MGRRRAWYRAALTTALVVAGDQLTKALVRSGVQRGEHRHLLPGIDLVNVPNRGIAFGLLSEGGTLLTVLTVAALGLLVGYFARNAERSMVWLPTGLLVGGAIGNMVDRVDRGAVTDFIDVPLWPSFNLADIAITFGVLALLYVLEEGAAQRARA